MRRLIIALLLVALPCFAAPTWRVTIKVERPGSAHDDSLKVHHAKHDSVQVDIWSILNPREYVQVIVGDDTLIVSVPVNPTQLGWAIIDNDAGTSYVVTVPDTIPIIGPIRSALGKYNQYVTVRKTRVD